MIILKLISKHQHGFLKKHSTTTNLLESVNDWNLSISNWQSVVVAFIDFQRANDSDSHPKGGVEKWTLLDTSEWGITRGRWWVNLNKGWTICWVWVNPRVDSSWKNRMYVQTTVSFSQKLKSLGAPRDLTRIPKYFSPDIYRPWVKFWHPRCCHFLTLILLLFQSLRSNVLSHSCKTLALLTLRCPRYFANRKRPRGFGTTPPRFLSSRPNFSTLYSHGHVFGDNEKILSSLIDLENQGQTTFCVSFVISGCFDLNYVENDTNLVALSHLHQKISRLTINGKNSAFWPQSWTFDVMTYVTWQRQDDVTYVKMCLPSLVTDSMRRFLRLESSKKLQGKNARGWHPPSWASLG